MCKIISKNVAQKFRNLCGKYKIAAFFLFGSSASGKTNQLSDLDIAYLSLKTLSDKKESELYVEVIKYFKRDDIDLVDLSKASLLLKYSAIQTGKIITCVDDKELYNFIVKTRSEYLDTQYIRDTFFYYLTMRAMTGQLGGK